MPSRRGLQPGAAPARVFKFLKGHPKARQKEIAFALNIEHSTVRMALFRLARLGLYASPGRALREPKPKQSSPSPTESFKLAQAQFSAAAAVGPTLLFTPGAAIHPTGTPFAMVNGALRVRVGDVRALAIMGTQTFRKGAA